ncbi:MAG TPA: hypothetical protein VFV19_07475 [Candidatus Polarisedimenticolaceae bacterium]|nr:hypothetical protein [Candidatus Polarisedimenticolaceae bacterium]
MRPIVALVSFHAASGARVAMRAAVPLAGAITVTIGLTPNPYGSLRAIVAETAAPRASVSFDVAAAALAFSLAAWAAPRLTSGAEGWMASLPAGAASRRRALVLGIALAQAPLVTAVAGFSLFGGFSVARIVTLVLVTIGTAYAVLPRRRLLVAPLAAAGAIASFSSLAAGAALVIAADLVAGRETRSRARARRTVGIASAWRLAWRATARAMPEVWALAGVPLLVALLFTRNNTLVPEAAARASRLGAAAAIVVSLSALAGRLAMARPPWRWARSLPWTSRHRIVDDAVYLGAVAVPIVLVAAFAAPLPATLAALALPAAAIRAAGAIRRGRLSSFFLEGMLGAMTFALLPWVVVLAAAATPWLLAVAARDEARLPVSRFVPLAHQAGGDPASWSGR